MLARNEEAEHYYRLAYEKSRLAWGEDHPETATTLSNVGVFLLRDGQYDEAERVFAEALEIRSGAFDGFYSSSRTCEIGLSRNSGIDYKSVMYLIQRSIKEKAGTVTE